MTEFLSNLIVEEDESKLAMLSSPLISIISAQHPLLITSNAFLSIEKSKNFSLGIPCILYFISPILWFRLTPKMETFFDEVFAPGFAYEFVKITKIY